MATTSDWVTWHDAYEDPDSPASVRLTLVQRHIRDALDEAPAGPLRAVSMCAGDGRDLLDVLATHARADDVTARLVELDPELAGRARARAAAARLTGVEIVTGDAADVASYHEMLPADLVLVCGVFGNIPDEDIRQTVQALPGFCKYGATVIWTRHRKPPDITPAIRAWCQEAGFAEVGFDAPTQSATGYGGRWDWIGVGVDRFLGSPFTLSRHETLFTFNS